MVFGLVPFLLWVAGVVGIINPITEWQVTFVTMAMEGLGFMIYTGKGDNVGEAFMSWFKNKSNEE